MYQRFASNYCSYCNHTKKILIHLAVLFPWEYGPSKPRGNNGAHCACFTYLDDQQARVSCVWYHHAWRRKSADVTPNTSEKSCCDRISCSFGFDCAWMNCNIDGKCHINTSSGRLQYIPIVFQLARSPFYGKRHVIYRYQSVLIGECPKPGTRP